MTPQQRPGADVVQRHPIISFLLERGQEHVFQFWPALSDPERDLMIRDLSEIPVEQLKVLLDHFEEFRQGGNPLEGARFDPEPVLNIPTMAEEKAQEAEAVRVGLDALKQGEVAVFLVAGGQGTRLEFDGPKGCFPITPIKGRSLFHLFSDKIVRLEERIGRPMPWIVMTSHANHADTVAWFRQNDYFGRPSANLFFITQDMWPSLSLEGRLLLSAPNRLAMNPNGHGGSLIALHDSGMLDRLAGQGVRHLFYYQVDNPLVRIADPAFIGHHILRQSEMSTKVVAKTDPAEKVGVVGRINGEPGVIEYSDLPAPLAAQRDPDGRLSFRAGNTAIHCFDIAFLRRLTAGGIGLPVHVARKKVPHIDPQGRWVEPERPNGIKMETFVFDAMRLARRVLAMEIDRAQEFAPVKNAVGEDSPATSRAALHRLHMEWIRAAGYDGDEPARIEICPRFADSREDLAARRSRVNWERLKSEPDWYLGDPGTERG